MTFFSITQLFQSYVAPFLKHIVGIKCKMSIHFFQQNNHISQLYLYNFQSNIGFK